MVPVATERLLPSGGDQTDEDLADEDMASGWAVEVLQLPASLELDVRVRKGSEPLGISVDAVDRGENGMLVIALAANGAMARDGRVVPGDYLISVNNESLRRVTNAQARAILRRAQLLSADISVTYIPGEAAAVYRKSLLDAEPVAPPPLRRQTQISPSSPYIYEGPAVDEEAAGGAEREDSDSERDRVGGEEQTQERLGYEPGADSEGTASGEASPADAMTVTRPDRQPAPPSSSSSSALLARHWGPERTVEVLREPNCSLGISIVGGKVDLYNAGPDSGSAISGIFIKNVLQQSPAGRAGELKTGDRILEVDGIDLRQASHERAVEVIRGAGNPVRFLVQSLIQWSVDGDVESQTSEVASASSAGAAGGSVRKRRAPPPPSPTTELLRSAPPPVPPARTPTPELIQEGLGDVMKQELQQKKRASVHQKPPPPGPPSDARRQSQVARRRVSISERAPDAKRPPEEAGGYSSSEDSDEEDVRDLEGRIITKTGREIDRASAANIKRTPEEITADTEEEDEFGYTTNKARKKYAAQGQTVVVAQLERGHQGLGISLAGHKDRSRMAVFVCGLNPAGSAFRSGGLQVGDEILEVNGVVLQGRCHLNASAIIKGLAGPIFKVIALRRDSALADLAVKPITQFPVTLDDETPEEKYSNFKGLRTVSIKKGAQGLGIMIIEGKHAEVGQGIFISDIQEGSAAEQAGLVVGDMILAVNKDTLLGSDYDSAASLLKKTEGIVTLVVCNPNKAKEEDRKAEPGGAAVPDAKGARSPTPTKAGAAPALKEPEKPRLLPKPIISSSKPQKPLPPKSLPATPSSLMPNEPPSATPARPSSLAVTPDTVNFHAPPCGARLSPTPSGKLCSSTPEEPAADPTTCEIVVGKETTIEINKDKMGLGLSIVGGSDTLLSVIIIHEVYPDGAAAKDGRLKPGDQILEVNSEDFRSITHSKALAALRQTPAKVKMVVFRDESTAKDDDIFNIMEVELTKKPGKGLGLSIVGRKNGNGVFISDVVHGGTAEADGRLMKGDQILAVNGQDLKGATQEEAAAVLKTATGRVTIKLGRLKATSRGGSGISGSDRDSSASPAPWADTANIPCSVEQTFPRLSTKRASLIRHFATWSFRRRNL
ncbi:multiple PDZ domain protein isoform X2 [Bacillus rossius redtenbacheri]|uniref:multiple PDZ domain protein isoform X2 n=1 Tax=Bacillus rossius redtenbacheri TaxID=93214 RepID=UPI002FDD990C